MGLAQGSPKGLRRQKIWSFISRDLFQKQFGHSPQVTAYAPGRIEFISNHTDYNGGAVLGAAVDLGIEVSASARDDHRIRLASAAMGNPVEETLENLVPVTGDRAWANYPLGVVKVLRDEGLPVTGFDFAAVSNLPTGAGMSSSAALELSTLAALSALQGCEPDRAWMASICRRAENEFVGVPCGILDQGVSAFGRKDHLVHIDCHTETFTRIPMPKGCHFRIFNSNKKHALLDSKYSERHRECREAFEILRKHTDATCLAHVEPEIVRKQSEDLGETRLRRALHVTEEHRRVAEVVEALEHENLECVGELLTASHRSSQNLFENSIPELDFLVDELTKLPNVLGARLTGGGFGGAVMALTDATFSTNGEKEKIAAAFNDRYKAQPAIFHTTAGDGVGVR